MEELLEELVGTLASKDGMARKRARETLVLVGEPAVAPVRALLASPEKQVRWEAVKTLAAMIDTPSVEAFVQLLQDPRSEVRWLAGDGLINLGPRSARPVLKSLLHEPLSPGHRQMARRVLRQLSSDNEVLAEITHPVVELLEMESLDSGVVASKAERALVDLDHVTGRLPVPGR
jgi:HEAT repeat protein